MITPMKKYDLVVLASRQEEFLSQLQELGLVDVTVSSWEPSDDQRTLMTAIDLHTKAEEQLKAIVSQKDVVLGEPYASGQEAFESWKEASDELNTLKSDVARYAKMSEELRPWGDFSAENTKKMVSDGMGLRLLRGYEEGV